MEAFSGFPDGLREFTAVPDLFFSELMPAVDDLSELKVTLYCLWLVQQKKGEMRHVTHTELSGDAVLMAGLGDADLPAEEALRLGLERAVARGTLLEVAVERPGQPRETWYLINSERGRGAVARIERDEWVPPDAEEGIRLQPRRPNIYNLYEQNIGLIRSPILAEELEAAEEAYPPAWIVEAFRIAVNNNARRWSYVQGILERWAREGRDRRTSESKEDRRRYVEGEYGDQILH
ncbi:MAG: DnaD domain-containing protein [Anaerolineae bacterium]